MFTKFGIDDVRGGGRSRGRGGRHDVMLTEVGKKIDDWWMLNRDGSDEINEQERATTLRSFKAQGS